MKVIFSTEAKWEVHGAIRYDEAEVDGLGSSFLRELRTGVGQIKRHPLASRIIKGDFRRLYYPNSRLASFIRFSETPFLWLR